MDIINEDLNEKFKNYVFIDEAGRGCCAGPMVFCAVKIKENQNIDFVDDSKKLSKFKRIEISKQLIDKVDFFYVIHSAKEIDDLGIITSYSFQ